MVLIFFLSFCILPCSGYKAVNSIVSQQAASTCLVALPSNHTRYTARIARQIYTVSPSQLLSNENELLRNCTVVAVFVRFPPLSTRRIKNDVAAQFVEPDSNDGRKWHLGKPVLAISAPRKYAELHLRVWLNCSFVEFPTRNVWRVVEACTSGELQDQSVVSLQKKRVRRENGNDDGQEKSLAGWKHVVLSFMLILSFTILLAMCAKSKSKDITSVENCEVVDEKAATEKINLQKGDDVGARNELGENTEREVNERTKAGGMSEDAMSKTNRATAHDAGDQTSIGKVNVDENEQRDEEKQEVQMSDSGAFVVSKHEVFSGDGYAKVRAFSNNADCVVNAQSDSEGDEHVAETEAENTEDADLLQSREYPYPKVACESQSQLKSKLTHAADESPTQLKSPQVEGTSIPPAHVVRPVFRFGSTASKSTADRASAPQLEEKGSHVLSRKVQHQELVKDMGKERNGASTDNHLGEVHLPSAADAQPAEEDWYSTADVEPSEEDWYSKVDRRDEDMTYSSIEDAKSQSGQQPPPLPPINKHPKAPFLFEIGKKASRDGPLPPTPQDDCSTKLIDKTNDFSTSVCDHARSFTVTGTITGPKEDPPYDKPFKRSQSEKEHTGLAEGNHITDISALYSKVDLSKKKRNVSVGEQQHVRPVQNVDPLYAKPFKRGRQPVTSDDAVTQDDTATAQLAEDGYSCVSTKSQQHEPNYSEVGPAARSAPGLKVKHSYEIVSDVAPSKQSAILDAGYDSVGAGSTVMAAVSVPDPGYDSIGNDLPGGNAAKKDPDYENVNEARARGESSGQEEETQEQVEQTDVSTETELPQLEQEPNYDEIDDDFREQIELYRQRSESKGDSEGGEVL
ncbi:uncharacterized protein LOC134195385 isoform X2 [Corticium candelabrum]|uniref:uncharacterized protein LOC134195385 isoform X2 n=1 Tax=Corticium candelabrum TaxID=121492 RepID=UPI002E25C11F|nr:uncharacterized protein LOC134195385 isoform X2 [Corticium candelabrum]